MGAVLFRKAGMMVELSDFKRVRDLDIGDVIADAGEVVTLIKVSGGAWYDITVRQGLRETTFRKYGKQRVRIGA